MTNFEVLRIKVDALLAKLRRVIARSRARLDEADDSGIAGVRVPVDRTPPSPRSDVTYAEQPVPRYHLDVVGTHGGKVTLETKR